MGVTVRSRSLPPQKVHLTDRTMTDDNTEVADPCGWCDRTHRLEYTEDTDEAECRRELVKKDPGDTCNARAHLQGEVGYCDQPAGWKVEGKDEGRCDLHGGSGGAPAGPDNGRWKDGTYSDYMSEDDQERAERFLEVDGEEKRLEAVANMLYENLAWEKARIERGMSLVDDPHREEKTYCRVCGSEVHHEDLERCPNPNCETRDDPSADGVNARLARMWDDPDTDHLIAVDAGLEMDDGNLFWRMEQLTDMAESYEELVTDNELHLKGDVDLSWPERLKMAQGQEDD